MAPFASNQDTSQICAPFALNHEESSDSCAAVSLLFEYPLVSTRRHIGKEVPACDDSLVDSEGEDDMSESTSSTTPSVSRNFLVFDPCTAVAESFASCTYYPLQRSGSSTFQVRTCNGCGRGFNKAECYTRNTAVLQTKKIMIPNKPDSLDVRKVGEKIDIDVVIVDESKLYCYECAVINQGRKDHESSFKLVLNELMERFEAMEEAEGIQRPKNKKERINALVSEFASHERKRKTFEVDLGGMKKAMRSALSSLQRFRYNHKHQIPLEIPKRVVVTTEEAEDTDEEIDSLSGEPYYVQSFHSSPKSLKYRFENSKNEDATPSKKSENFTVMIKRAKKVYSKIKPRKRREENYTRVRAVKVVWGQ